MTVRVEKLRSIHGQPSDRAQQKITSFLTDDVIQFIQESPFAVLSTADIKGNCDASPRGGKPGFVKILNNKSLLIPDIRGNRLLQSTTNLTTNPKAGLLFLIPGNNKSVRVNGSVKLLDAEEVKQLGVNNAVFNPDETYVFTENNMKSKSKTTAFINIELKGKIVAVFNHKKMK